MSLIMDDDGIKPRSLIQDYFTEEQLKLLYYNALRIDIEDNNDKADIATHIVGPDFDEVGTGTNRITFKRGFYVVKIALDKHGVEDNVTEFMRSEELKEFCAITYETNGLINIMEYVTLLDKDEFEMNKPRIKMMLDELSKVYIFEDLGFASAKNFANYGKRDDNTLVILDYGYLYKRYGNEKALMCPKCGTMLEYNKTYSSFICPNQVCNSSYMIMDIRRKMKTTNEEEEQRRVFAQYGLEPPNFDKLVSELYN